MLATVDWQLLVGMAFELDSGRRKAVYACKCASRSLIG
jgi:hypothetical protein